MVQDMDLNTLNPVRGTFVDRSLREHASDLLFRVSRRSGGSAYVYLLFEHKSVPDDKTAWQVLRYMMRIWEREWRRTQAFAPIVPIVVYHGQRQWNAATNFVELVDAPPLYRPHVPQFSYVLYDLSQFDDATLKQDALLGIALLVLKYAVRDELRDHLRDIFVLFGELLTKETGLEYLETVLRYISMAGSHVEEEEIVEALREALPGGGETVATIVDRWIEQGVRQGLQRGLQQGLQQGMLQGMREGRRESIVTVLRARFGEGPDLERVAQQLAQVEDLDELQELLTLAARVDSLNTFITALEGDT